MLEERTSQLRVVLLADPGWRLAEDDLPVDVLYVDNGYEAAAELLANPDAALAADLACLTQPHLPLLDLAVRLHRPVAAFGTVRQPIPPEKLAGIHLTSREQVVQTLVEIASSRQPKAEPSAEPAKPESLSRPQASKPATAAAERTVTLSQPARLAPRRSPAASQEPRRPANAKETPPAAQGTPAPIRPIQTLTKEELDALLEEKP